MSQPDFLTQLWSAKPLGEVAVPGLRALPLVPLVRGLAAYREHAKALSVRALGAAFPRCAAWMGEVDFRGLAWAFARAHPPRSGDAAAWGEALPDFVDALPGIAPEAAALARLDWALHRLAFAADDPPPQEGLWAALGSGCDVRLQLSAHLRALPLPLLPALAHELESQAFGGGESGGRVLVWRSGWQPRWGYETAAEGALRDALQRGQSLHGALEGPTLDFSAWLTRAAREGWLLAAQAL